MIILGVDPGSIKTGWGVLNFQSARFSCVEYGVIRTREGEAFPDRLLHIFSGLEEVLQKHRPQCAVVEGIFFGRRVQNFDSTIKLGQARGVCMLALARAGVAIVEYSPAEIKKSISGSGRADKFQMRKMVEVLLRQDKPAPEDAADALAMALVHGIRLGARGPL